MKDNEQSRFIRWGIPGWMTLLAFISFVSLDIILSPSSSKNSLTVVIKFFTENLSLSFTATTAAALLVAAAGIPLGFAIYQVYFYIRWNSPFSSKGFFPPFIVGRQTELKRTIDGIDPNLLVGDDIWRMEWTINPLYNLDHGWKWRYIENLFNEVIQYMDSSYNGFSTYARYRYLMDLMHSLGAGLFGIYLGFLGYIFLKVKTDDISLSIILGVSVIGMFFLVALLDSEDRIRREKIDSSVTQLTIKPFKNSTTFQITNPSLNYLLFIFTVLYLGSPSPYTVQYTPSHFVFRVTIIVFLVLGWMFSKKDYDSNVMNSELTMICILEGVALIVAQWLRNYNAFLPEWWNIGWCLLLFLVANMIFIKNRQNTRDDLIAMQNYALKRYFSNTIKPFSPPKPTRNSKAKHTTKRK